MSALDLISFHNEVFRSYVLWGTIMVTKMLLMGPLTALQRFKNKTFANPEDLTSKDHKVKFDDPDVERCRRAHRNDMENIVPYLALGFYYVMTNPSADIAIIVFRAVGIARIVHTLVYAVFVIPQPARALSYFVGLAATVYMAVRIMIYAF
ncbi:microsomal glutathione S-transferase 1-like [Lucilia sericata]|uniref:microsomal glutathione S-transferase 1-like n=1 Tax=Lucilia sericata TaxID=13632 RepID=UPI0018A85B54|nr:microsomal glutathione S-transferase 1-like [Lucilia sericata]